MNVGIDKLEPGTFGVSHGSGVGGEIIRHATGSWAGHAFLYLGNGTIVEGAPPEARLARADKYDDAIWAYRMWDKLREDGWTHDVAATSQAKVIARGHALVGQSYDWPAYVGFCLEILKLRSGEQMSPFFMHDTYRVCSALVDDAEVFGGVPMTFVPFDGPSVASDPKVQVTMPPNLVAPGMLLGIMQRLDWA